MDDKLFDKLMKTLVDYGNLQFQHNSNVFYSYYNEELSLRWNTGEDSGGNCWG